MKAPQKLIKSLMKPKTSQNTMEGQNARRKRKALSQGKMVRKMIQIMNLQPPR